MFYIYRQGNPGGYMIRNSQVSDIVVIEASSYREANAIAEENDIYFSGVELGRDCSCCGDRWHPREEEQYEVDKYDISDTVDDVYTEFKRKVAKSQFTEGMIVYYKNGEIDYYIDKEHT